MPKHGVTEFLQVFESDKSIFFDIETDLMITLDGGGNVRRVNPAFERVLGYTERDVMGISLVTIISMRDIEIYAPLFVFLKKGGGLVTCQVVAWRTRNSQHYAIFRKVS